MSRKAQAFLTLRETRSLFRQIGSLRDYCVFLLAYRHGLRSSEVCALKVHDIDLDTGKIFLTRLKGSRSGFHVFDKREKERLEAWLKIRNSHSPYMFPSGPAGHISRKTLDRLIKKYGERAKLPVGKRHFHILKHSIAVHMLEAGAEIKLVQELLGHKNIQNTLVYAQLVSKYRDEKQAELFKSDKIF
jgi:integrase